MRSPLGLGFAFEEDADEALCASRDYFWVLREGFIEGHTAHNWRAFRAGYTEHGQAETEGTTEPTPPHPTAPPREAEQDCPMRPLRQIG
jgi:hypothetical protein